MTIFEVYGSLFGPVVSAFEGLPNAFFTSDISRSCSCHERPSFRLRCRSNCRSSAVLRPGGEPSSADEAQPGQYQKEEQIDACVAIRPACGGARRWSGSACRSVPLAILPWAILWAALFRLCAHNRLSIRTSIGITCTASPGQRDLLNEDWLVTRVIRRPVLRGWSRPFTKTVGPMVTLYFTCSAPTERAVGWSALPGFPTSGPLVLSSDALLTASRRSASLHPADQVGYPWIRKPAAQYLLRPDCNIGL